MDYSGAWTYNLGGSGYEIELPDGIIEKFYVNLPSDIVKANLHFPNPPESHLGKHITDNSIEHMSRLYLDYLQRMVKDAKNHFGIKK